MSHRGRLVVFGAATVLAACALASCSSSPSVHRKAAGHPNRTTTTSTVPPTTASTTTVPPTTLPPATTSTVTGVAVPDVIGLKIAAAHAALRAATLTWVSLSTPCNKGTLASQSVVSSLATPGKAPDVRVGVLPLRPGTVVPFRTQIGIIWSGCFGDTSNVPAVTGLTFTAARQALHAVGLTWACYTVATTTTTTDGSTTTTVKTPPTVLTQTPAPGTVVHPGTAVSITMDRCPQ